MTFFPLFSLNKLVSQRCFEKNPLKFQKKFGKLFYFVKFLVGHLQWKFLPHWYRVANGAGKNGKARKT